MFDQLWATTCLYLGLGLRGPPSEMSLTVVLTRHMLVTLAVLPAFSGLSLMRRGERSSREIGFTNGILGWK